MTAYVRELTLQDRLDRMLTRTAPILGPLFNAAPKFSAEFKRTRNENTHLGNRKPVQVDAVTIHVLTELCRYLLDVSLMLDLGFSVTRTKQLIQRQDLFHHLIVSMPPGLA